MGKQRQAIRRRASPGRIARASAAVAALTIVLVACQLPGPGVSGPAGSWATVPGPWSSIGGLVVSPGGVLYVSDPLGHRVWAVGPDGAATVLAGNGTEGHAGDGGPATEATLGRPARLALDPAGNVYVTDPGRARVRRIARDGTIDTVLGTGVPGSSGDGGPAVEAQVVRPWGIAVVPGGGVLVTDLGAGVVRRVHADGTVTTWLGSGATTTWTSPPWAPPMTGWPVEVVVDGNDLADGPRFVVAMAAWPCAPGACAPEITGWWTLGLDGGEAGVVGYGDPGAGSGLLEGPGLPTPIPPVDPDVVEAAAATTALADGGPYSKVWVSDPGPGALVAIQTCTASPVVDLGTPSSPDGAPVAGSQLAADPHALVRRPSGDLYVAVGAEVRVVPGLDPDPTGGFTAVGCAVGDA